MFAVALVTRKDEEFQRHHVVIFYDKERPDGEKNKNGNTSRMCMRELVDPDRNGTKGVSRLREIVGDTNYIIPVSDTGNAFRGIPQCWYYSTFKRRFGLTVECIPLPPRHAHNYSDHLLARLNTFFKRLLQVAFLIGTLAFFEALNQATNPSITGPRRLVKRCTVIYCHFRVRDSIRVPKLVASIVEPLAIAANPGKPVDLGVMKLGYFMCTVSSPSGEALEGVMHVRRFANTKEKPDAENPLMVFDMINRDVCQTCSNRKVACTFPVSKYSHILTRLRTPLTRVHVSRDGRFRRLFTGVRSTSAQGSARRRRLRSDAAASLVRIATPTLRVSLHGDGRRRELSRARRRAPTSLLRRRWLSRATRRATAQKNQPPAKIVHPRSGAARCPVVSAFAPNHLS
jgi:hypothetical protein